MHHFRSRRSSWRCRVLARSCLAKVCRALVLQHLQPRALDQGARDRGYAQGDPRGEDLAAAREKAIRVIEKLRGLRLSRAAELAETAVEATLTYYAFPEEHWRRIRTNNPLERILRDPTGALVSWARSLTVNPRSTSPPQGCATSPSRRGRPRDI